MMTSDADEGEGSSREEPEKVRKGLLGASAGIRGQTVRHSGS